jgi:hypothetical protein
VLPDESAAEFHALQEALLDELAPAGALQTVLARRVAVAAWRLARADRMEIELFEERRWENAGVGMALIRDGNGTRSFETLMRYRSAAMAELMRALRTLKALQAEAAAEHAAVADRALEIPLTQLAERPPRAAARRAHAVPRRPNEPEPLMAYLLPEPPAAAPALHETAAPAPNAPAMPNEPEPAAMTTAPPELGRGVHGGAACWMPNEPERGRDRPEAAALTLPDNA